MVKNAKSSEYQSCGQIQKKYSISAHTLRSWADSGTLQHIRLSAKGKRLYHLKSLEAKFCIAPSKEKKNFIYARVSSSHQKADLQRQIEYLQSKYPTHSLVKDIASGLNFKRKGLQTILEQVLENNVQQVVVAYKDRLCRYGIELLEFIFKKFGTELVVHGEEICTSEPRELADDLLSITTVFVARHNGRRSQANRRKRKESAQNKIIPNQGAEKQITEMVRGNQVDVQPMCVGNQEQTAESEQESITGVHH
jgi:putative resolvase